MNENPGKILIGCAGWSLPRALWPHFPAEGTHLSRYAARLSAVEINSSFYRSHKPDTYRRWAASVPTGFRFSVKLPRAITHEQRLRNTLPLLDAFLQEVAGLEEKLGAVLVQLPPSLVFNAKVAQGFLLAWRERFGGVTVWEARHPSWFGTEALALLTGFRVAQVAADPAPVLAAALPDAWQEVAYYRLHGSPRMYYSAYGREFLEALTVTAGRQLHQGRTVWCVFDNTAEGAATANALFLQERFDRAGGKS